MRRPDDVPVGARSASWWTRRLAAAAEVTGGSVIVRGASIRPAGRRGGTAWVRLSVASFIGAACLVVYLLVGADWRLPADSSLASYLALTLAISGVSVIGLRWLSLSGSEGGLDILELPVWYTLWTFLSVVLFGFLAFTYESKYELNVPVSRDWVATGLWLPLTGLSSLWCGYALTRLLLGKREPGGIPEWWRPQKRAVILFYGLIALERLWRIRAVGTAYGAISSLDELSGFNQWSLYLEDSAYLVLAITALEVFRCQWRASYLACMVALEVLFALVAGSTKPFLWLGVVLFGAWHYSGRSIRPRLLWTWLLVLLTALLAVPVVEQYRSLIAGGAFDTHSPGGAIQGIVASVQGSWATDPGAATEVLIDKLAVRQALVAQTLGLVVELTPSVIPFWGVERLLAIPTYLVPRLVWPDKPNLNTGVYFAINYLQAPQDTVSSAAFTVFGDLYVSAGWTATIVGMALLGVVSAIMYHRLKVVPMRRGDFSRLALYVALAVSTLDVEGSYIGIMVGLVQRGLLYAVIFWLLHAPGHSRSPLHLAVRAV